MIESLEHDILEVLYTKPLLTVTQTGSDIKGHTAIYKREYPTAYLEFGVLVDILNAPEKYKKGIEGVTFLNEYKLTVENVTTDKYNFVQVSDAIESLTDNGHVEDKPQGQWLEYFRRDIYLTPKGAIAYRNQYYLREAEEEQVRGIKAKISKFDYNEKKYKLLYYIFYGIIGAVIGVLVTLVITGNK